MDSPKSPRRAAGRSGRGRCRLAGARGAGVDARYANGGYRIDRAIVRVLLFPRRAAHTHVTYGCGLYPRHNERRPFLVYYIFIFNPPMSLIRTENNIFKPLCTLYF